MSRKQFAIIGMVVSILFWVLYFIMSSLRPEYSFKTDAVSELGTIDAPNKWLWNIFGYFFVGLMISLYSFGLFKGWLLC